MATRATRVWTLLPAVSVPRRPGPVQVELSPRLLTLLQLLVALSAGTALDTRTRTHLHIQQHPPPAERYLDTTPTAVPLSVGAPPPGTTCGGDPSPDDYGAPLNLMPLGSLPCNRARYLATLACACTPLISYGTTLPSIGKTSPTIWWHYCNAALHPILSNDGWHYCNAALHPW